MSAGMVLRRAGHVGDGRLRWTRPGFRFRLWRVVHEKEQKTEGFRQGKCTEIFVSSRFLLRNVQGRSSGTDSPSTPGRKKGSGRGRKKASTHNFEPTPGDPDKPFACERKFELLSHMRFLNFLFVIIYLLSRFWFIENMKSSGRENGIVLWTITSVYLSTNIFLLWNLHAQFFLTSRVKKLNLS